MRLQDVECVIKSLNTFKHFSYLGTGKMLNDDKSEGLVKKKKKKKKSGPVHPLKTILESFRLLIDVKMLIKKTGWQV